MRFIKMILPAAALIVLSISAGCSDQITSSGETGSSEKGEGVVISTVEESLPVIQTYRAQIRIKPQRAYTFDVMSTGFDRFYSIDINNLSLNPNEDRQADDCRDILVYSNNLKKESMSCHSNGFEVSQVTVENTGTAFLDLDVTLRAFKQSKVPVIKNK